MAVGTVMQMSPTELGQVEQNGGSAVGPFVIYGCLVYLMRKFFRVIVRLALLYRSVLGSQHLRCRNNGFGE